MVVHGKALDGFASARKALELLRRAASVMLDAREEEGRKVVVYRRSWPLGEKRYL